MNEFERSYSVGEVSEKIDVPRGSIREWEDNFDLEIPRNKDNHRYYTKKEIDILVEIKRLREKNVSKDIIRDLLNQVGINSEGSQQESNVPEVVSNPAASTVLQVESLEVLRTLQNQPEEIKEFFISELKPQMMDELRKELESRSKQLELRSETRRIEEKEERFNDIITQNRVNSRLEEKGLELWSEKPEAERVIRTGFLGLVKVENINERDRFVRSYVNEHFEKEMKKDYGMK